MNGGNDAFLRLRLFETYRALAQTDVAAVLVLALVWLVRPRRKKVVRNVVTLLLLVSCSLFSSCMKPYDTPGYAEIDTSETGFLIPLEGDSGSQAKFQSEQYLRDMRSQPSGCKSRTGWSQDGRFYWSGRWIPTVRLIKVNRSPVTREWTAPTIASLRTRTKRPDRDAVSVGFSMGFTCTSFIAEEDPGSSLYPVRSPG